MAAKTKTKKPKAPPRDAKGRFVKKRGGAKKKTPSRSGAKKKPKAPAKPSAKKPKAPVKKPRPAPARKPKAPVKKTPARTPPARKAPARGPGGPSFPPRAGKKPAPFAPPVPPSRRAPAPTAPLDIGTANDPDTRRPAPSSRRSGDSSAAILAAMAETNLEIVLLPPRDRPLVDAPIHMKAPGVLYTVGPLLPMNADDPDAPLGLDPLTVADMLVTVAALDTATSDKRALVGCNYSMWNPVEHEITYDDRWIQLAPAWAEYHSLSLAATRLESWLERLQRKDNPSVVVPLIHAITIRIWNRWPKDQPR